MRQDKDNQTDRQIERQTDKQLRKTNMRQDKDSQADRLIERQTDRMTHRQKSETFMFIELVNKNFKFQSSSAPIR